MKVLKALSFIFGLVVVLLVAGIVYLNVSFPKVGPAEAVTIDVTPDLVARGEYLANYVSVCIACHSERDFDHYAGCIVAGTEGAGGTEFDEGHGIPGRLVASNLTPAGIGDWTDGEIIRAIRQGVNKDGKALFPLMAYTEYKYMRDEDVQAIVAYLRTLKPIENDLPKSSLDFPMNMIVKMIPGEVSPMPEATTSIERGQYLVHIADCAGCHTPLEKGKPVSGKYLAGGTPFPMPGGTVYAANITPDEDTGIGVWEKEDFILRFKAFADSSMHNMPVGEEGMNTEMPWIAYSGMTEEDLGAIYDYLMSIDPVSNPMERFVGRSE